MSNNYVYVRFGVALVEPLDITSGKVADSGAARDGYSYLMWDGSAVESASGEGLLVTRALATQLLDAGITGVRFKDVEVGWDDQAIALGEVGATTPPPPVVLLQPIGQPGLDDVAEYGSGFVVSRAVLDILDVHSISILDMKWYLPRRRPFNWHALADPPRVPTGKRPWVDPSTTLQRHYGEPLAQWVIHQVDSVHRHPDPRGFAETTRDLFLLFAWLRARYCTVQPPGPGPSHWSATIDDVDLLTWLKHWDRSWESVTITFDVAYQEGAAESCEWARVLAGVELTMVTSVRGAWSVLTFWSHGAAACLATSSESAAVGLVRVPEATQRANRARLRQSLSAWLWYSEGRLVAASAGLGQEIAVEVDREKGALWATGQPTAATAPETWVKCSVFGCGIGRVRLVEDSISGDQARLDLHVQLGEWPGEPILAVSPYFYLVTDEFAETLKRAGVTGCSYAPAQVGRMQAPASAHVDRSYFDQPLPTLQWLRVDGRPGVDDLGVTGFSLGDLIVSTRVRQLIERELEGRESEYVRFNEWEPPYLPFLWEGGAQAEQC